MKSEPKPLRLLGMICSLILIAAVVYYLVPQPKTTITADKRQTQAQTSSSPQASAPVVAELPNASCHARGVLPDPACTPGAASPLVTQANITSTICTSGYTKTVRPAVSYTDKLKVQQMQEYGFTDSIRLHEEDHLISLELGGDPSDPKNLWPEPGQSPNPKDKVENALHTAVCSGRIPLKEAQTRIATDWTTALQ